MHFVPSRANTRFVQAVYIHSVSLLPVLLWISHTFRVCTQFAFGSFSRNSGTIIRTHVGPLRALAHGLQGTVGAPRTFAMRLKSSNTSFGFCAQAANTAIETVGIPRTCHARGTESDGHCSIAELAASHPIKEVRTVNGLGQPRTISAPHLQEDYTQS